MAPQTVLKLPTELSGLESRPQILLKLGKLMKFSGLEKEGSDRERDRRCSTALEGEWVSMAPGAFRNATTMKARPITST
jgi:hypothetical protein